MNADTVTDPNPPPPDGPRTMICAASFSSGPAVAVACRPTHAVPGRPRLPEPADDHERRLTRDRAIWELSRQHDYSTAELAAVFKLSRRRVEQILADLRALAELGADR